MGVEKATIWAMKFAQSFNVFVSILYFESHFCYHSTAVCSDVYTKMTLTWDRAMKFYIYRKFSILPQFNIKGIDKCNYKAAHLPYQLDSPVFFCTRHWLIVS